MDKEQAIVLAKRYKEMVAERLPLKALYLYGSYSKGNYREDSDIDIAVVVEHWMITILKIPLYYGNLDVR